MSHLHLLTGNFEAGWAGQQARLKLPFRVREALRAIAFRRDGAYAPPCHEDLVMQQD
jgi:hypothetical protein